MYCESCGGYLLKNNHSCSRFDECKNNQCYRCAKKYVSSTIRYCSRCNNLGTCEICADYDYEEINRRKKILGNNPEPIKNQILQMCISCVNQYIKENDNI